MKEFVHLSNYYFEENDNYIDSYEGHCRRKKEYITKVSEQKIKGPIAFFILKSSFFVPRI